MKITNFLCSSDKISDLALLLNVILSICMMKIRVRIIYRIFRIGNFFDHVLWHLNYKC